MLKDTDLYTTLNTALTTPEILTANFYFHIHIQINILPLLVSKGLKMTAITMPPAVNLAVSCCCFIALSRGVSSSTQPTMSLKMAHSAW